MIVLGIETSCDETATSVVKSDGTILSNLVLSQLEEHKAFGGVVPELASRDHIKRITPLLKSALSTAGLTKDDIDGVSYTAGPGLIGALMVGAVFARSLAWAWGKPSIGEYKAITISR